MTGRERIQAALSDEGSSETPAVICYEGIYIRDRWDDLSPFPWWYRHAPDVERQILWRREAAKRIGQDWFQVPSSMPRQDRESIDVEALPDGVFETDRRTGERVLLERPGIGGWSSSGEVQSVRPSRMAESLDEIDALVPVPTPTDCHDLVTQGRADLAGAILGDFGKELYPMSSVPSPLWRCYRLWGFEGLMTLVATRPELVEYACHRLLAQVVQSVRFSACLGAAGIWIEECLTDMIGPKVFESINVPVLSQLVRAIRAEGMKSIYYFCGNPDGKWDQLLSVGADALALEESKKGFEIDIEDVVDRLQGRCALLGNLDAVGILQDATEDRLRAEISRQISAGRRNGGRFILSTGSPVTPGTPPERVRLYCDLVRELGSR